MEKVNFKLCDPEKEVEGEVLRWAFRNRWSLDVYDSKGTYSKAKGRYSQNTGMKTLVTLECATYGSFLTYELHTDLIS